jgi:hypothetical protein
VLNENRVAVIPVAVKKPEQAQTTLSNGATFTYVLEECAPMHERKRGRTQCHDLSWKACLLRYGAQELRVFPFPAAIGVRAL